MLAGLWDTDGCAIVDPARLAWGLRQACLEAGVRICEEHPGDVAVRAGRIGGALSWHRGGHGPRRAGGAGDRRVPAAAAAAALLRVPV